MSVRKEFKAALAPHLPKGWRFYHYSPSLGNLNRTTLVLAQRVVKRAPAAPQGADDVTLVLTVIGDYVDPEKGEDRLENALDATLNGLDKLKNILIGDATRVKYADTFPAYDIDITLSQIRKAN